MVYMEDNIVHKLIDKFKMKLTKNKKGYPSVMEYAFSSEELADLNKQNKQKIQDLKKEVIPKQEKKEKITKKNNVLPEEKDLNEEQILPQKESELKPKEESSLETEQKDSLNESEELENKKQPTSQTPKNSFIDLSSEHQSLIMDKWNGIDQVTIEKDILEGKDLLNHNYTITYADDAARYIHKIRKNYEIVLCYLIGFNNEKKGIYDKTIFSDKMDNEWKYLNNYIKVLEKIRNFKKQKS